MPRYFTKGGIKEPNKEYEEWFNNLKANRRTSDDTFTPPKVYEILLEYINEKLISIDSIEIQRPFYPGGDYQKEAESYNEKSVVIDTPQFSLMSEILDFYTKNNIKFFLFSNGLTAFHYLNKDFHLLCPYALIEYDNGVKVNTCFMHNLKPKGVTISGELRNKINSLSKEKVIKRKKYKYPNEVLSVAQSLELVKKINGEVTFENYKDIAGLNVNGKQKKVFCKALLLSKSEQEKLDKIRAELGIIKTKETKKTNKLNKIHYAIIMLSLVGASALSYCYGFNKETIGFILLFTIPIIVLSLCLIVITNKMLMLMLLMMMMMKKQSNLN